MIEQQQLSCTLFYESILKLSGKLKDEDVFKLNGFAHGISEIRDLDLFPNLQIVSFSLNKLSTLTAFSRCYFLQELHLRKNKVDNLKEIFHLLPLRHLHTLLLTDNPCCSTHLYRQKVGQTLKGLKTLDTMPVEEREDIESCELKQFHDEAMAFEQGSQQESITGFIERRNTATVQARGEIEVPKESDMKQFYDEEEKLSPDLLPPTPGLESTSPDLSVSPPLRQISVIEPSIHSNTLMAARFLLSDMSEADTRQLAIWCQEKLVALEERKFTQT